MEWQTTIVEFRDKGRLAEFDSGHVFQMDNIEIHDHKTLERIYVKASVCKDPAKLPDGDVLWIKDYNEQIIPQSARIKILEKLPSVYDSYR